MASTELECGICSNVFSDDHCPRILPCSHTFCGSCIDGIVATQNKTCPLCRKEFTASSAEEVMINRSLLDVAKRLSSLILESKSPSKGQKQSFLEFTNDFREKYTKKGIAESQEIEGQVKDLLHIFNMMKDSILKTNKEIDGYVDDLQELKLFNENKLREIEKVIEIMMNELLVMRQKARKIHDTDAKLEAATDVSSAEAIMDEAEDIIKDGQEMFIAMKELLHKNEKERDDYETDILNAKIRLSNIAEEIVRSIEDSPKNIITVKDLRSLRGLLRWNTQRQIFAVTVLRGKQRLSHIKIESNNQISVSHLEEGDIPPNSIVIRLDTLMEAPRRAFIDLGADGIFLGRIVVRVMDASNLALNFLHMCVGDLGPSYSNTSIVYVGRKGEYGEGIAMGNYVKEGGRISREAVMLEVDWEREKERKIYQETSWKAGEMRGIFSYEKASAFYIITRDDPSCRDRHCFGMVEEGLQVLRDAMMRYSDIKRIKIVDCGLLFSLSFPEIKF